MSFNRFSNQAKKFMLISLEFTREYNASANGDVCYVSPEAFSDWLEYAPNLITGHGKELRFMGIPFIVCDDFIDAYKGDRRKVSIEKNRRLFFSEKY